MKLSLCKPLVAALLGTSLTFTASAATITKSSGPTTPLVSDFSANFAGHPTKVGYGVVPDNTMFIETFNLDCGKDVKVSAANLSITVRRGGAGSANDSITAFANGSQNGAYLSSPIWLSEPQGATKTMSFNVATQINVTPNRFSFAVQDDTSVLSARLEYTCAPRKKGLTFGLYPQNTVTGMATPACQGSPGAANPPGPDCNPYEGDTYCTEQRPLLCMKSAGLSAPPGGAGNWSGNVIATTAPMLPPTTLTGANSACAAFGPGWTVAEFHAGGGWKFGAYGDYGNHGIRAWVDVNDQANGTCWTRN